MALQVAILFASARVSVAWVTKMPWFDKYEAVTDLYRLPNGIKQRLPLRLHSHELVLTGTADADAAKSAFGEEYYTPVTVGGKVPIQIWMNNFTDTDCGLADLRNPYLETWTSTWVTPKDQPLDLPYDSAIGDMSYIVTDPRALIWIHRVICADAPGVDTSVNDPALGAILGGHGIFGFPKHKVKARIEFEYNHGDFEGSDRVHFNAKHLGKDFFGRTQYVDALTVSVQLPEQDNTHVAIPVDIRTADDAVVGGPLFMVQQIRFGEAFNVTQNIAHWNEKTDTIKLGTDDYYSSVLKAWNFEPKLKMHTDDFQIAAFKPSNWMPPGPPSAKRDDRIVV